MHRVCLGAFGALAASAAGQVATFRPLGLVSGGLVASNSSASGVSADGSVVSGSASVYDPFHGFTVSEGIRWTQATGWQEGAYGGFAAVSSDTSTIVGWGFDLVAGSEPYYEQNGFTVYTGIIVGGFNAASASGDYAVGFQFSDPVRWSQAHGVQVIPAIAGFGGGSATGVSADGGVVVGSIQGAAGAQQAFIWTPAGGTRGLGYLAGATSLNSRATGVSADGRIVVGTATNAVGQSQAFFWTAAGGMRALPLLDGAVSSYARATSADGSVVVGAWGDAAPVGRAYYWDRARGRRDLQQFLVSLGATGLNGWTLRYAAAVSPDGAYIVGTGTDPQGNDEGWIAHLPAFCYANCDGSSAVPVLNVNDFTCFLNRFVAGDPYANCDGSTIPPGLNVGDFVCYLNKFAAGCP